uniref:hypothetical protein n=1 Tax=Nocardia farcinica TaxID=37329 RepID=UPI002453E8F9
HPDRLGPHRGAVLVFVFIHPTGFVVVLGGGASSYGVGGGQGGAYVGQRRCGGAEGVRQFGGGDIDDDWMRARDLLGDGESRSGA